VRWPGTVCGGGQRHRFRDEIRRDRVALPLQQGRRVPHLLAVGLLRPHTDECGNRWVHRRQRHQGIAYFSVADIDRQTLQPDVEKVGGNLGTQPGAPRIVGLDSAQGEDHFLHHPNLAHAPIPRSCRAEGETFG
jgi:hypothetical protein